MKTIHLSFIFLIVLFFITIMLYAIKPLGENFYKIGDLAVCLTSFITFLSGFYAFKLHRLNSIHGKTLILLALGILFWFLGEFTWSLYEIVLNIESPKASLADAFWLIGNVLFFLGLCYMCRTVHPRMNKIKLLILMGLAILSFIFVIVLSLPTLTADFSFLEKISTIGYVVFDFAFLDAVLFSLINLYKTKLFRVYFLISLSIICMAVADIYYMNFFESYEVGNWIDLFWNLDYILLAVGLLYNRLLMEDILKK